MESLFDDPMIREIYRRGARDSVACVVSHLPPATGRALDQWLTELDQWREGNPPPPPQLRTGILA